MNNKITDNKQEWGIHFSVKSFSDVMLALDYSKSIGANIVQIYFIKLFEITEVDTEIIKANKIKITVHGSYNINLPRLIFLEKMIAEMHLAYKLNAYCYVVHIGRSLKLDKKTTFRNIYRALVLVYKDLDANNITTRLALETPAGQGSEVAASTDDLIELYKLFPKKYKEKIYFCVDTCHIFAAGYDIRTKLGALRYINYFQKGIGLSKLILIHLNDSKRELGSHIDRHEVIGKGYIGFEGVGVFYKLANKLNIPVILEISDSKDIDKNVKKNIVKLEHAID